MPVLAPKVDVERMTQLVKDAIGFDATRGDIVSVTTTAFVEPPMPEPLPAQPLWEQPWLWEVGKQAAGGLFVLVLFFGLLRPAVKSLMAKPVAAAIADDAASSAPLGLAAPGGGAVPALTGPQVTPLTMPSSMHDNLEQVKQIVAQDPRIAAQVVKEWLGD